MDIILEFEIAMLLTLFTGTAAWLFWATLVRFTSGYRLCYFMYSLQKAVWLFYVFPVLFLVIRKQNQDQGYDIGSFATPTPLIQKIAIPLALVWLVGFCITLGRFLCAQHLAFRLQHTYKAVTDSRWEIYQEVCREQHIRRKIGLYEGDMSLTPSMQGILRPGIYLGSMEYSEQELRLIFMHELTHFLHRDLWMLYLLQLLSCIYWFIPFFRKGKAREQYRMWSEDACDVSVCQQVDMDEYHKALLSVAIAAIKYKYAVSVNICETQSDVLRRIDKMKKHKIAKEMKRSAATALVVGFLLAGSTVAYAAGNGVAAAYDVLYNATVVEYVEEPQPLKEMEEYYEADGWQSHTTVIEVPESAMNAQAKWTSFEWTIGSKILKKTSSFYMSAGGSIYVSVSVDQDDKNVNVGIIDSDGSKRYIIGSGNITHEFAIDTSGYYSVFVENRTTTSIDVGGYYRK